jgi:hypothetical protein
MQVAIRNAVAEAFKTPDVIKIFAAREPGKLRERLLELERHYKLGSVN